MARRRYLTAIGFPVIRTTMTAIIFVVIAYRSAATQAKLFVSLAMMAAPRRIPVSQLPAASETVLVIMLVRLAGILIA